MRNKVFISYAREDQRLAEKLYLDLRQSEINAWIDIKCLLPGQNWKREIKKSIKESAYFIALISNNSISKRGYIQREMKEAIEVLSEMPSNEIFIIPVRLENVTPSDYELMNLNWVDLYTSYTKGLARILSVLSHLDKEKLQFLNPSLPIGTRAPIAYEPYTSWDEFIREVLSKYPQSAHFIDRTQALYIGFETMFDGVKIPEKLKLQYPEKMLIVLQNQYVDLILKSDLFSIGLWFNEVKETLTIPYKAIFEVTSTVGFRIERVA